MKFPESYRQEIDLKLRALLLAEINGSHDQVYEYIYPVIRFKREAQYPDEPNTTIDSIKEFLERVVSAELKNIEILGYYPVSEIYGDSPAVKLNYTVLYNRNKKTEFNSIWVRYSGTWYSTSINKVWVKNA